jgi:hypothetical protein
MNFLVFLDPHASELEKILSGVKTMLIKEIDPAQTTAHSVSPGDNLYFLRDKEDNALRVRATVIRAQVFPNHTDDDLSRILKEMQPRLQLTEDQFNYWSVKGQVLLVTFGSAQKISMIQIASETIADPSAWIAFEAFSLLF